MIFNQETNINNSEVNTVSTRRRSEAITMPISLLISSGLHVLTPFLLWGILFILALLGINLLMFNPPEPKIRDIEFKIVQAPEQKPLTETKNRAERDTRAGGKNNPRQPESEPQPKAAPKAQSQAQPKPRPQPQQQPKQQPRPQPKAQPQPRQPQPKQQQQPQPQPPRPQPKANTQPPMPIPFVSKAPKPMLPKNPMAPPINIASGPKAAGPSSNVGPITSNKIASSSSSGSSGSSGPAPITLNSPTKGGGGSPGSSSRPSSGSSRYGSGNPGNPSAGNAKGAPGINAKKDPDFGPYMAELQRRIKRNWDPPKGSQSKRVILLFTVARDGRLLNLRTYKSSGEPPTDRAAVSAVQLSAPFRELPSDFSGSSIDIQFTFDYNVFGVGGRSF